MQKKIIWLSIFAGIIAVCLLYMLLAPKADSTAVIRIENKVVKTIDLNAVTEPQEFTVDCENGTNTIRAEHGKIRIISSDCDDKLCVDMGYITDSTIPIVCLPHKLSVSIENSPDAISGGN